MAGTFEIVAEGFGFVEGIRWRDGRVWFSDFGARRVMSVSETGAAREEAWVPGQPSGLGFACDGALLVVSVHEGHILRFSGSDHFVVADIGAQYRGGLNDMVTLPDGRSYVSAFPTPVIGAPTPPVPADGGRVPLFMVAPNGAVSVVAEGLRIPNGLAVSADSETLFVAETMGNRILAYPVLGNGALGQARAFSDLGPRNPDGIAIDRRGRLWVASPFTSEFIRLHPDGSIDRVVTAPNGVWAVACAVGADDDELWCATVETSIADYQNGRARGSIMRWRA